MHAELRTRRRVLILASQRYAQADRASEIGLGAAAALVPEVSGHGYWMIGNPGSRLRRLYDQRQRALERLDAARDRWDTAKRRVEARQDTRDRIAVLLLT